MNHIFRKGLALVLVVAVLVGMMPPVVAAAAPSATATQPLTTSVSYDSTDREKATITYHKEGETAPACNVVFLLDASVQGGNTLPQLQQMLKYHVGDLIDHTNANMQVISYTQNVIWRETDEGHVVTTASGLYDLINGIGTGEGTADAAQAIDKATEVVGQITNDNPTVVFWAFGKSFGTSSDAQVEEALQKLTNALSSDDALITWQLADAPNALVQDYATTYTAADGDRVTAAYAKSDADAFRAGTLDSLDRVFHDHYRDLKLTLPLASGQTLAKKITAANWDSDDYDLPKIEATVDDDAVTLSINKLCANITGDLTVDLVLDTDVNEKQTVLSQASASGRYTGFFDETKDDTSLVFPAVELDRQSYTITFDKKDATGDAPDPITAMAGQYVTLPDGGNLSKDGSALGGWNDSAGNHYTIGQIIAMPAQDLTLTPAWGHVEIELELGEVHAAAPSENQMAANATSGGLLNFVNQQIGGGQTIAKDSIHSVQVIDRDLNYGSAPDLDDQNRVNITTEGVNAVYARHIGATAGDHVVAYLRECQCDEPAEGKYDLIIAGPGGVVAPENMSWWMVGLGNTWANHLDMIDLRALDTSHVTDMSYMFYYCGNLKTLTFGEQFDTSNVTNMTEMFSANPALEQLDLTKFNTSNVTSLQNMFYACRALKSLNLSSFDTSKVTTMQGLLVECEGLESVDISSFDTSQVTNMEAMFKTCKNLKDIRFGSKFTTVAVTNMREMFRDCYALTRLNLSKFNTSSVKNMENMFANCTGLQSIELGENFDTSKVTTMEQMFNGCKSLTSLTLPETFNTAGVTSMKQMFNHCESLTDLTLPKAFDTSKVENMWAMFADNPKLQTVDLSQADFDTSQVKNMEYLFSTCGALETVKLGGQFYLQNVEDLHGIFQNNTALTTIDGAFVFSADAPNQATTMNSAFYACHLLKGVEFAYVDQNGQSVRNPDSVSFPALKDMTGMFAYCDGLTRIDLGGWVLPDLTNTVNMFIGCDNLTNLDLSWTTIKALENDFYITNMFNGISYSATLDVVTEDGDQLSTFMQAVVEAFPGTVYVDDAEWSGTTTNESPTSGAPTPGDDTTTPSDEPQDDVTTPEETPSDDPQDDVTTPEETPVDEPQDDATTPEETPSDDPQDNVTTPEETPVDEPSNDDATTDAGAENTQPATASARVLSEPAVQADGNGNYTVDGNIWTHKERTPAGSQFQYLVRVKYVGDTGAQSGSIQVRFPIPEKVRVLNESELKAIDETKLVEVGAVEDSDTTANGFLGGRVTNADYDDTTKTLTATVDGLYAGNEVEISIWCTNESKTFPSDGGYVYWDGTASAQDEAASVPSNIYRLWDVKGAEVNPPEATNYTLSYQFAGNVPPDATLPKTSVHKADAEVIAAEVSSKYDYYHFDGWTYSDGGTQKTVDPGDTFTMPNADTTLVGTWTHNEKEAPTMTVHYKYDDSEPANAPEPPADAEVTIGDRYTVSALQDNYDSLYASFNGWVPSLSVDGDTITLTKDENGLYSGGGYSIPTTGVLATTQFLDQKNVVLTFIGSWTAYSGTIQFDANGGSGSMEAMTDVTHDTTEYLPANAFTRDGYTFLGWALSEDGNVVKADQARANGLITKDDQTVTLYAQWAKKPVVVETVTITPEDQTKYTGGEAGSGSGSNFPHPIYLLNNVEMGDDVTFLVNGEKWDTSKGAYPFSVKYYDDNDKEITTDTNYGDYTARIVPVDGSFSLADITTADGKKINFRDGTLRIRYVSDSTEASNNALTSDAVIYTAATEDSVRDQVEASGEAGVLLPQNTTIYLNGDHSYDYPTGTDSAISLFFDDLLPAAAGGDSDDFVDDLIARAEEEGFDVDGKNTQFKYLDLVDSNNANAWVSSSQGSDIFWPYPAGVDENDDVQLLHFKDLHREYRMGNDETALKDLIAKSDVEDVKIEKTDEGIWFHVPESGFSPFALVWEDEHSWWPDWPDWPWGGGDEPDNPPALNTEDHFSYVVGYEDGMVKPQRNITRAEVASIFYRLLKEDVRDENTTTVSEFSDVSADDWYGTTVATLSAMNIVKGYEDGTFRPNASITRAEYIPGTFTDVIGDEWFAGAIADGVNLGLIGGYEDGSVRPNNAITRAEACAIVNRTLGRVPDADHLLPEDVMKTWPDNPETAWYYADMQEATNGHEYEWITEDGNKVEEWTEIMLDNDWTERSVK